MTDKMNTDGRKTHSAQALGLRNGSDTADKAKAAGKRESQTAGPDGPDATVVGETFKKQPAQ